MIRMTDLQNWWQRVTDFSDPINVMGWGVVVLFILVFLGCHLHLRFTGRRWGDLLNEWDDFSRRRIVAFLWLAGVVFVFGILGTLYLDILIGF